MKGCIITFLLIATCIPTSINAQNIYTTAGSGSMGFSGDGGAATSANLSFPYAAVFDASGNMYISDANNHRIRKVDLNGIITTYAGTGAQGASGDGGAANLARFSFPYGMVFDGLGNLFVADYNNHRIRKITPSGIISTFAGTGVQGFSGDGGAANLAQLSYPISLAVDASNNIYIADGSNHRIRKVNTSGIISTVAGNGIAGDTGDGGPATSAKFQSPYAVALDGNGNIYIAAYGNNKVRKVNTSGIISTFAGNGVLGYSGDGGSAPVANIAGPYGLATDLSGNIYIAESIGQRIRKVDGSGIITTYVGTGVGGYGGDGASCNLAQINGPAGISFDAMGNFYIADVGNNRIRKVCVTGNCITGIEQLSETESGISIYPNPNLGSFIAYSKEDNSIIFLVNNLGQQVFSRILSLGSNRIDISVKPGLYSYCVLNNFGTAVHGKILIE